MDENCRSRSILLEHCWNARTQKGLQNRWKPLKVSWLRGRDLNPREAPRVGVRTWNGTGLLPESRHGATDRRLDPSPDRRLDRRAAAYPFRDIHVPLQLSVLPMKKGHRITATFLSSKRGWRCVSIGACS